MPVVTIPNLGEKPYEELMSNQGINRSLKLKEMFVVTPAFKSLFQSIKYMYPGAISTKIEKSYVSKNESPLSKKEIKSICLRTGSSRKSKNPPLEELIKKAVT